MYLGFRITEGAGPNDGRGGLEPGETLAGGCLVAITPKAPDGAQPESIRCFG